MNELFSRLIGKGALEPGQAGVEFGFAHPLPAWGWALVVLAGATLGYLCYRRLEGARPWRILLGSLRTLLLILLAFLLAGPRLSRPNESEERDWVLILVDRSASMGVADAGADGTRERQLRAALEASRPVWAGLAAERVLVWLGFDASTYDLPLSPDVSGAPAPLPVRLGDPVGRRTDLGGAIEAALRRAAARPLSGIVLLSDGRSTDAIPRAILRRLEAERIPVFTVPLGSERSLADLAVRRAEAPRFAFVRDTVPVQVELERIGGGGGTAEGETAIVELIDDASGAVLDRKEVSLAPPPPTPTPSPEDPRASVTLTSRPSVSGATSWSVRVRSSTGGTDLVESNNRFELQIELIDRPLRVAYFEGYPRWEYRYLKTLLVREPSLTSVVMLLAPGRRYLQEGTIVLDTLPRSPEEWANFDVLILGDLVPGVFTNEQLAQIRERVSTSGTGLIWIGGESATPGAWRGTPLADLLPFSIAETSTGGAGVGGGSAGSELGSSGVAPWETPVVLRATPAADRLGVLRLSDEPTDGGAGYWPARLSDPQTGWSLLRYAQKLDPASIKPTAEILALAEPVIGNESDRAQARPAVLSMRYGSGRIVYVATDEIWRWRYGQGERLPERFWLQLVRLLGRESVARQGRGAIIEATPARAEIDQPVRVQVTLLDQTLVDANPPTIRVRIVQEGGGGGGGGGNEPLSVVELALTPESGAGPATTRTGRATARSFGGTWIPSEAGRYRVEAADPLLASAGGKGGALSAGVEVWRPDDEMRQPQADHAALARLSEQTQGKSLSVSQLDTLPSLLPNRRIRITGEPDVRTLWDTPLALVLVVLLLTLEWVGRRVLRFA